MITRHAGVFPGLRYKIDKIDENEPTQPSNSRSTGTCSLSGAIEIRELATFECTRPAG